MKKNFLRKLRICVYLFFSIFISVVIYQNVRNEIYLEYDYTDEKALSPTDWKNELTIPRLLQTEVQNSYQNKLVGINHRNLGSYSGSEGLKLNQTSNLPLALSLKNQFQELELKIALNVHENYKKTDGYLIKTPNLMNRTDEIFFGDPVHVKPSNIILYDDNYYFVDKEYEIVKIANPQEYNFDKNNVFEVSTDLYSQIIKSSKYPEFSYLVDGVWVKEDQNNDIFYIENGKRYKVLNDKVLESYGQINIFIVNKDKIQYIPIAGDLGFADGSLVTTNNIYSLILDKKRNRLISWKLNNHQGFDLKKAIQIDTQEESLNRPGDEIQDSYFINKVIFKGRLDGEDRYFLTFKDHIMPLSSYYVENFLDPDSVFLDLNVDISGPFSIEPGNYSETFKFTFQDKKMYGEQGLYFIIPKSEEVYIKGVFATLTKAKISFAGESMKEKISNLLRIYCEDCQ